MKSFESELELLYVFSRRLLGSHAAIISTKLMYRVADRFDAAVARHMHRRHDDSGVFIGMAASSAESMHVVKRKGGVGVLNFVNSHPIEHNRYLREFAGLRECHQEMVPTTVASKVEKELELADLILVPSGFVAKQLVLHGVPACKVAVAPYGVDLKAFSPEFGDREKTNSRDSKLQCLFVGQISHGKGIRFLLDAAKRCQGLPVMFRLIGPIVSSEVLTDLPNNVTYEGVKTPHAVGDAMRQADIFILPTFDDSFGLVVFEAMASGLPVITTSQAGASEIMSNGIDGFIVPPCDAGAIYDAINKLVEDSELRRRIGSAAMDKVRDSHSWEYYGRKVLSRIQAVLARRCS